jgi:hypothetical protein
MLKNENLTNSTFTDIIKVNSIVDLPSSIEDMYNLQEHNILAVSRSDNTLEIWSTKSWIQLIKIPGMKSKEIK